MHTEALLTLNQWFSPSYPLGSFAYSHGLETAIQNKTIATAAQLEHWLRDVLVHGTGRSDATLVHAAYRCHDMQAVTLLDAQARAYASSAERLMETELQGDAFCRTTTAIWGVELPALTHPVAVGYAAARLDLPVKMTATLYLHAFTANLVSCAVRLVPLGQTEGQAVLQALALLCRDTALTAADDGVVDLATATFAADIAAMRHETLQHRIFRT